MHIKQNEINKKEGWDGRRKRKKKHKYRPSGKCNFQAKNHLVLADNLVTNLINIKNGWVLKWYHFSFLVIIKKGRFRGDLEG